MPRKYIKRSAYWRKFKEGETRIAICISGIPENHDCSVDFVRRLAAKYNTHLFMWHWECSDEECLKAILKNSWSRQNFIKDRQVRRLETIDMSKYESIEELYMQCDSQDFMEKFEEFKQKRDEFEKGVEQPVIKRKDGFENLGPISMYYAIMQSNLMREQFEKENDIKFDVVMRVRFDVKFFDDRVPSGDACFNFKEFNLDIVNMPAFNVDSYYGICDQLAFANRKVMGYYSRLYENIHEIATCLKKNLPGSEYYGETKQESVHLAPELMLGEYLKMGEIEKIGIHNACSLAAA